MKYYTICFPADDVGTPRYEELSETDILNEYWDYWYGKMCAKFGVDYVDVNYSVSDCIDDWVVVNWAVVSDCDETY